MEGCGVSCFVPDSDANVDNNEGNKDGCNNKVPADADQWRQQKEEEWLWVLQKVEGALNDFTCLAVSVQAELDCLVENKKNNHFL